MKTLSLISAAVCIGVLSLCQAYGEEKAKTEAAKPQAEPGQMAPMGPRVPGPAQPSPFMAGKQPIFQPVNMDPALMRQSMQARSEYDDLNRRIMARQSKLYEENTEIKKIQGQLRELQKKIDKLMSEDAELNALKKEYEAIVPAFPMGARKGLTNNAMPFSPVR